MTVTHTQTETQTESHTDTQTERDRDINLDTERQTVTHTLRNSLTQTMNTHTHSGTQDTQREVRVLHSLWSVKFPNMLLVVYVSWLVVHYFQIADIEEGMGTSTGGICNTAFK